MVTIGMEALFVTFGLFIAGVFGGSPAWSIAWFLVTMAVSFYVGARTTARLSGAPTPELATLNGLATWGLAILGTLVIGMVVTIVLAANSGPTSLLAATDWGSVELWFGSLWGGVVLSLVTAYSGARVQPTELISAGVAAGVESTAATRRRVAG
jgi:uncharacterized membrane protein